MPKSKLTKKRAREICEAAAATLLAGREKYVCPALAVGASTVELEQLQEALFSTYSDKERFVVIWKRSDFDYIDDHAREARIIGLLLLPEFI